MHFVECETLAHWLLESPERVLVVDLRDTDYCVGRVRSSRHVPFKALDVDALLDSVPQGVSDVVLHCRYSQMRGPSACEAVVRRLNERLEGAAGVPPETCAAGDAACVVLARRASTGRGGRDSPNGLGCYQPRELYTPESISGTLLATPPFRVSILRGGFEAWHERFHANPLLYEALSGKSSRAL